MKMYQKFMLLAFCLCSIPAFAQWQRTPTPNDTLQSTRVLPSGEVVLSIYAPEAKSVNVTGDLRPWGKEPVVNKAANGVWSVTVPALKDGVYRYGFTVDGVKVYDPKAPESAEISALYTQAPAGGDFFSMKNVPHGAIAQRYYFSKELNQQRRLHVWTPAGYEKSADKLPVLYLIHGGGDTDFAWPTVGAAGAILDNLMAEGKMKPMVVVMPNGSIQTDRFVKDLMGSIIPFIEDNYRVLTDKDNRALAGLSMGGLETLETAMLHYQHFGYFWVLSSGWFANNPELYAEKGAHLKKIAADFNQKVRQLVFTMGGSEDIAYQNCKEMLKLFDAAGVKYQYSEMPGGHTWYVWRHDLFNMAQKLFK